MSVLEAVKIGYAYGGVRALSDVSLSLEPGRIVVLVGGNGAGKSTLIRILSGVLEPDAGYLLFHGKPIRFDSPRVASEHGVITVQQDLSLVPQMSVWRNFVLGAEPAHAPLGALDVRAARTGAQQALERFGLQLDLDRPAARLSGGQRQILAICRALHRGARVLILDEPTASLAVDQAARVLAAVRQARSDGTSILFVTHNPQHARELADQTIELRMGQIVPTT